MHFIKIDKEIIVTLANKGHESCTGEVLSVFEALSECERNAHAYLAHEEGRNVIHISFSDPSGKKHVYRPSEVLAIAENRLKGRERLSRAWD